MADAAIDLRDLQAELDQARAGVEGWAAATAKRAQQCKQSYLQGLRSARGRYWRVSARVRRRCC